MEIESVSNAGSARRGEIHEGCGSYGLLDATKAIPLPEGDTATRSKIEPLAEADRLLWARNKRLSGVDIGIANDIRYRRSTS